MKKLPLIVAIPLLLAACEPQAISDAKEAVKRDMKDPDSTQFRDVQMCDGNKNVVKGHYNSKNEMGGYVGFKPFFYSDRLVTIEHGPFSEIMRQCYSNLKFDTDGNPVDLSASR